MEGDQRQGPMERPHGPPQHRAPARDHPLRRAGAGDVGRLHRGPGVAVRRGVPVRAGLLLLQGAGVRPGRVPRHEVRLRDVVVAWRGTKRMVEWASDLDIVLVPVAGVVGPGGRGSVHRGFLSLYTSNNSTSRFNKQSAREQVLTEVRRLLDTYKDENSSVTVTGHSLGAALSTLNAIDLVANGINAVRSSSGDNITVPVTAILFGSPRVGDEQFKKAFESMAGALSLLRVRNAPDIVPAILPTPFYRDVGVELLVDTLKSPYLKTPAGPAQWHNLECYLHAVAGTQGPGDHAGFSLEVDRDVALVNKEEDALKGEYPVPASWWAENNKGMVKNAAGHWVLEDHEEGNLAL